LIDKRAALCVAFRLPDLVPDDDAEFLLWERGQAGVGDASVGPPLPEQELCVVVWDEVREAERDADGNEVVYDPWNFVLPVRFFVRVVRIFRI
jgi:hypothetical protein